MPTRPDTERTIPEGRSDAPRGGVFGREWWGLDRDRLENKLARQEAGEALARDGQKPH